MLGFILYLLLIGLVAGFIARAVVPGKDSMSIGATIVLGIVGSFIGGFIGYVLTHGTRTTAPSRRRASSDRSSGAIVALLIYRAVGGRSRRSI